MRIHNSLVGPVLIFEDLLLGSTIEIKLSKDDIAMMSRPVILAILNNGSDEQRRELLAFVDEIYEVYHERGDDK